MSLNKKPRSKTHLRPSNHCLNTHHASYRLPKVNSKLHLKWNKVEQDAISHRQKEIALFLWVHGAPRYAKLGVQKSAINKAAGLIARQEWIESEWAKCKDKESASPMLLQFICKRCVRPLCPDYLRNTEDSSVCQCPQEGVTEILPAQTLSPASLCGLQMPPKAKVNEGSMVGEGIQIMSPPTAKKCNDKASPRSRRSPTISSPTAYMCTGKALPRSHHYPKKTSNETARQEMERWASEIRELTSPTLTSPKEPEFSVIYEKLRKKKEPIQRKETPEVIVQESTKDVKSHPSHVESQVQNVILSIERLLKKCKSGAEKDRMINVISENVNNDPGQHRSGDRKDISGPIITSITQLLDKCETEKEKNRMLRVIMEDRFYCNRHHRWEKNQDNNTSIISSVSQTLNQCNSEKEKNRFLRMIIEQCYYCIVHHKWEKKKDESVDTGTVQRKLPTGVPPNNSNNKELDKSVTEEERNRKLRVNLEDSYYCPVHHKWEKNKDKSVDKTKVQRPTPCPVPPTSTNDQSRPKECSPPIKLTRKPQNNLDSTVQKGQTSMASPSDNPVDNWLASSRCKTLRPSIMSIGDPSCSSVGRVYDPYSYDWPPKPSLSNMMDTYKVELIPSNRSECSSKLSSADLNRSSETLSMHPQEECRSTTLSVPHDCKFPLKELCKCKDPNMTELIRIARDILQFEDLPDQSNLPLETQHEPESYQAVLVLQHKVPREPPATHLCETLPQQEQKCGVCNHQAVPRTRIITAFRPICPTSRGTGSASKFDHREGQQQGIQKNGTPLDSKKNSTSMMGDGQR